MEQVLEIFRQNFPYEYRHIRKYWDAITNNRNVLLKGDIQSGKTMMMIALAILYAYKGINVFVVLRNSLQDLNQFVTRYNEVVRKHFQDLQYISRKSTGSVRVDIYSAKNLMKAVEVERPGVAIVDEADLREDECFRDFIGYFQKTVFVSATVQDMLIANWGIHTDSIISLEPRGDYRGVNDLQFAIFENVETEVKTIIQEEIMTDREWKSTCPDHPRIVLVSTHHLLSDIEKLYEWIIDLKYPRTCVIKYTAKVETYPAHIGKVVKEKYKFLSIRNILSYLETLAPLVQNVFIVAGQLSNRGINFASNRYHITHQILSKPVTSTCASVLQACRICGLYKDRMPLKMYTTRAVYEKIVASYTLVDDIVRELRASPEVQLTNEACKNIVLDVSRIPRKFTKKSLYKSFIVRNGFSEGELTRAQLVQKLQGWSHTNTVIAKFLRGINPRKTYAPEELLRLGERLEARVRVQDILSIREKRNGYGCLLDRVPGGFRFREDLLDAYDRYFSA